MGKTDKEWEKMHERASIRNILLYVNKKVGFRDLSPQLGDIIEAAGIKPSHPLSPDALAAHFHSLTVDEIKGIIEKETISSSPRH